MCAGQQVQVQVPIGASAGLKIQFDVDARYGRAREKVTMQVTLPPESRPGQLLTVAKPNGAPSRPDDLSLPLS